jgi:hypothetical protein
MEEWKNGRMEGWEDGRMGGFSKSFDVRFDLEGCGPSQPLKQ